MFIGITLLLTGIACYIGGNTMPTYQWQYPLHDIENHVWYALIIVGGTLIYLNV